MVPPAHFVLGIVIDWSHDGIPEGRGYLLLRSRAAPFTRERVLTQNHCTRPIVTESS